jgi:N-acetylglucosamine-6-phosphate deacetylase
MDGTIEAVGQIAQYHALFGTTSMLATTTTDSLDRITKAVRATRRFIETGTAGANVIGIHLEGPYINSEERGAQNVEHVRSPSLLELRRILEESGDLVRIVTLAPEAKGALEIIAALRDRSIVASAGHSNATYAEMVSAIEAGITHVTHIFNGMRKFHHREPGIVGAALTRQELTVSLIADGIHVHPSAVRLLFRAKGADDIVLISDAIRAAGMSDGSYDLGGLAVTVTNGVCRLASGTLAGSTLTLNTALRNVVNFLGVPLSDALKMTSANPARVIGFGHSKGALEEGKDADIVILDEDLNVRNTIVRGRIITGI